MLGAVTGVGGAAIRGVSALGGVWRTATSAAGRTIAIGEMGALDAAEYATVYRVQGGASYERIIINAEGNPIMQTPNRSLNVSIGDASHAEYFQNLRGSESSITSFKIPSWLNDFIEETAIPQYGYRDNPLNQRMMAPKITDPTTPGRSFELPPVWTKWLEEYALPGSGKTVKGGGR